jgi:tetratricopeptide (TPR) repeat protein
VARRRRIESSDEERRAERARGQLQPARPDRVEGPSRWKQPLLVFLVTFSVFLPSLGNDFVGFDDAENFLENSDYRGLGGSNLRWMFAEFHSGHYQPLSWLTLGLDYVVWGMDPFGYHLTNVLLHALAAAAFAWLAAWIRAGARAGPGAAPQLSAADLGFGALVALAWSLHPLRVEAVAWVTERREVSCGLLTLLALGSHLRNRSRWLTAAFAACAMLAKATAVTIPLLLVLVDLHRSGEPSALVRATVRATLRHAPLFVVAALVGSAAVLAQRQGGALVSWEALPFGRRLVLPFFGAAFCIVKSVWPAGLAPLHTATIGSTWEFLPSVWGQAALGLALVAGALGVGWRRRRRGSGWLCLSCAFFVMILPASGLGQSGIQIAADRYTYQPGWVLTLAAGLALGSRTWWPARWWAEPRAGVSALAVLAALAFGSLRQQRHWRDTESLLRRQVAVYPASRIGNLRLGAHYLERQPPDYALAERHLRAAVAADPAAPDARCALANLLLATGRAAEALESLDVALRADPDDPTANFLRGNALWKSGRKDEAVETFERLARIDPSARHVHVLLAKAQAAAGRGRDAVATFEGLLASAPDPALLVDFAWLLATHPDPDVRDGRRALELAEQAGSRGPSDVRTSVVLAAACAEAGDFERARRAVERAITGAPADSLPALQSLLAKLETGQALRIEPEFP